VLKAGQLMEAAMARFHQSECGVSPRYESLDAWRGIACLAVIAFHATLDVQTTGPGVAAELVGVLRWGWLGVPMFFVISGYCIAASLDSERRRGRGAAAFLARRFWRIFPPYWLLLLVTAGIVALVDGGLQPGFFSAGDHPIAEPQTLAASQWVGAITLTETWRHHVAGGPTRHLLGHSWSLCYEIRFYALAAALFFVARRRLYLAMGVFTVAVAVGRHACWHFAPAGYLDGFAFDGAWLTFAAGVLIYYQSVNTSKWAAIATRVLLAAGMAYSMRRPAEPESPLLMAFGFALLLSLLRPADGRLAGAAWLRPLSLCG
jgi:peptidoglycan/LPS O-acetylase OafA/YrhL